MDRLRSIVVVAVATAGLLGLGLLEAGGGSLAPREARAASSPSGPASRAHGIAARACSAPLDGFCAIGLNERGRGGGSGR